jgi:hypothetical protein
MRNHEYVETFTLMFLLLFFCGDHTGKSPRPTSALLHCSIQAGRRSQKQNKLLFACISWYSGCPLPQVNTFPRARHHYLMEISRCLASVWIDFNQAGSGRPCQASASQFFPSICPDLSQWIIKRLTFDWFLDFFSSELSWPGSPPPPRGRPLQGPLNTAKLENKNKAHANTIRKAWKWTHLDVYK